ncbi:hypothetical protein H8E06_01170 [bacterium]|nr:hypothetical protein [bacterium]
MTDISKKWHCTDEYLDKFVPIMMQPVKYEETLLTGKNPLLDRIAKDTGTDIYGKHYIEPWVLKDLTTEKAQWKLRQPYLTTNYDPSVDYETHIMDRLRQLRHPIYKRLTVIDKEKGVKIKFYSLEARKNFCINFQGLEWARNIDNMSENTWRIPKLYQFKPTFRNNLFVAVFEYVEGTVLGDKYEWTTQYDDEGKPDVRAGRAKPYWGKICGVSYKDMRSVKKNILKVFTDLHRASKHVDFKRTPLQRLDNEPEWEEIWQTGTDDLIWHIDDWNLENIIDTKDGYRVINLDRSVVTSLDNAIHRFVTDFRTETNIRWDIKDIYEATTLAERPI